MSTPPRPHFPGVDPPRSTLGTALTEILAAAGSRLRVRGFEELFGKGSPYWAAAHLGSRMAQVTVAVSQSALTDLWDRGILVARQAAPELSQTAELIRDWLEGGCPMSELEGRHPNVSLVPRAATHLAGALAEVDESWRDLRRGAAQFPDLLPVIEEAERAPELRRLYAYLSLGRLRFSRCTGYPFTADCPVAWVDEDGIHVAVADAAPSKAEDPEAAVRLLVSMLPKGCGPAIQGTAHDVERIEARAGPIQ